MLKRLLLKEKPLYDVFKTVLQTGRTPYLKPTKISGLLKVRTTFNSPEFVINIIRTMVYPNSSKSSCLTLSKSSHEPL